MRTFAVGDIHGCVTALSALIAGIAPEPEDVVIFLGDLIDRGPDSKGVLDQVMALSTQTIVIPIMGNHEEMMLRSFDDPDIRESWLYHGGAEALASFGVSADLAGLQAVPASYIAWLRAMRDYHETDQWIFTHGAPYPGVPLADQGASGFRWRRHDAQGNNAHMSGKTIVSGHSPQRNGLPWQSPGFICIDTFAFGGQWLTALELTT